MDLDAYLVAHQAEWQRLEELTGRRRLTGAEADELLDLYQRVSTHLSVVRSASPDPSVVTLPVGPARPREGRLGRCPHLHLGRPGRLLHPHVPGRALPHPLVVGSDGPGERRAGSRSSPGGRCDHPEVWTSRMTPAEIQAYVGTDFENYYSEFPHG